MVEANSRSVRPPGHGLVRGLMVTFASLSASEPHFLLHGQGSSSSSLLVTRCPSFPSSNIAALPCTLYDLYLFQSLPPQQLASRQLPWIAHGWV